MVHSFLSQFRVAFRLWMTVLAAIVAVLTVSGVGLFSLHNEMTKSQKEETRFLVEAAIGMVEDYKARTQSGDLSKQEAQTLALQALRTLRYGEGEYFFVFDNNHQMLMHPAKPELEGKSAANIADSDGKLIFREMVAIVNSSGEGHIQYEWPRAGSEKAITKISFVKGVADWDWNIATGSYMDNVNERFFDRALLQLIVIVAIILSTVLTYFFIIGSIANPLSHLAHTMNRITQSGDLTLRANVKGRDEIADIGRDFDAMIEHFKSITANTNQSSVSVNSAAEALERVALQTQVGMDRQQAEIESAEVALQQLSTTVGLVDENAKRTTNTTSKANQEATEGTSLLLDSIKDIKNLADEVRRSASVINELGEKSDEISSVTSVIESIAEQTNLLALNAAIEAARAGEQGRGFAVVADEVRALAKRTKDSTESISTMIDDLQKRAHEAVKVMETGEQLASNTASRAGRAGDVLQEISTDIALINTQSEKIVSATMQQASVNEELISNFNTVSQHAGETAVASRELSSASKELLEQASQLREQVSRFKV